MGKKGVVTVKDKSMLGQITSRKAAKVSLNFLASLGEKFKLSLSQGVEPRT
jgi:hypothetical protein